MTTEEAHEYLWAHPQGPFPEDVWVIVRPAFERRDSHDDPIERQIIDAERRGRGG